MIWVQFLVERTETKGSAGSNLDVLESNKDGYRTTDSNGDSRNGHRPFRCCAWSRSQTNHLLLIVVIQ